MPEQEEGGGGSIQDETQSHSTVSASMETPWERAAGRGSLGQFGQISLESRTDHDAGSVQSRPSGSQGDQTSYHYFEKRGQTVQTSGEKSQEKRG